jgi:hypothetical protein
MAFGSSFFVITNFLVERLGAGFDTKIEQLHIRTWNIANTLLYPIFLLRHLALLFAVRGEKAVGARVWHAARLGRSGILGDCGSDVAGRGVI